MGASRTHTPSITYREASDPEWDPHSTRYEPTNCSLTWTGSIRHNSARRETRQGIVDAEITATTTSSSRDHTQKGKNRQSRAPRLIPRLRLISRPERLAVHPRSGFRVRDVVPGRIPPHRLQMNVQSGAQPTRHRKCAETATTKWHREQLVHRQSTPPSAHRHQVTLLSVACRWLPGRGRSRRTRSLVAVGQWMIARQTFQQDRRLLEDRDVYLDAPKPCTPGLPEPTRRERH